MDVTTIACLLDALSRYDPSGNYDEVFNQVSARIQAHHEASKADICILICWKRITQGGWIKEFLSRPDSEVCARTRASFAADSDQTRLDALADLPGFHGKAALATALLAAYDPSDFGVMDRRAFDGLKLLGRPVSRGRGETLRYLSRVRELRDLVRTVQPTITARNIDQALWVIGKENAICTAGSAKP
jgi:hypothetical protein